MIFVLIVNVSGKFLFVLFYVCMVLLVDGWVNFIGVYFE